MKDAFVKLCMFLFRHHYKIAGTVLFVSGVLAASRKDYVEWAAWLCCLAWMECERLSDKRADESERAVNELIYILHKVAKGEASASVDGNAITVRPSEAGDDVREWPKECDHA